MGVCLKRLVGKQHIILVLKRNTRNDNKRKKQHKGNHSNNKEAYTDRSKSTGRKVCFADITRRGALPKEASILIVEMTAIKIAMREIQKREEMRWIVYTDLLSSMLVNENNRQNHPILIRCMTF